MLSIFDDGDDFYNDGEIHNEEKKGVLEQKNTTHIGQEQEYDKQHEILYCYRIQHTA